MLYLNAGYENDKQQIIKEKIQNVLEMKLARRDKVLVN